MNIKTLLVGAAGTLFAYSVFAGVSLGEATLDGDQMTIPVTITDSATGTLSLFAAEAAPRDGEPVVGEDVAVTTAEVTEDGVYNLVIPVTLGTKVGYKAVLGEESAEGATIAYNNLSYRWVAGADGNWHDASNWTIPAEDGLRRLGYPGYTTNRVEFLSTSADKPNVVRLDSAYKIYKFNFNHSNSTVKFIGTADGAAIECTDGQEGFGGSNVLKATVDNVWIKSTNWRLGNNCALTLQNGAKFETKWWLHVAGDNAKVTVGEGCLLSTSTAGNERWYGLSLSGENAELLIDGGTVYAPHLRLGANGVDHPEPNLVLDKAIKGITFKGQAKLEVGREFVSVAQMPANPVLEFFVPVEGYEQAPVTAVGVFDWNYYDFLGDTYLDIGEGKSVTDAATVMMKVSPLSPFYANETTEEVTLVDWSKAGDNTICTDRLGFAAFEDPLANSIAVDATVSKIVASLTGTGEILNRPALASGASATSDSATGIVTVAVEVENVPAEGDTTAYLWTSSVGPNDDPKAELVRAETPVTVTEDGTVTIENAAVLGTQMAYAIELVYKMGEKTYSEITTTNVIQVADNATYTWKPGTEGRWSDPENWTCSLDDGIARIGYPSYGAKADWGKADFTAADNVVHVDGAYTGLQGGSNPGWVKSSLTLVGDVENAALDIGSWKDGCLYENVHLTIDNVKFAQLVNNLTLNKNASLVLKNGATMNFKWTCNLQGDGAYVEVGDGCYLGVSKAEEWHQLTISGEGSEMVISNGTVSCVLGVEFGSASGITGVPKGITFKGEHPVLEVAPRSDRPFAVDQAYATSPVLSFVIPEGGYEAAPLRAAKMRDTAMPTNKEGAPALAIEVAPESATFAEGTTFTLVDYSVNGASKGLNTQGLALGENLDYASSVEGVEATAVVFTAPAPIVPEEGDEEIKGVVEGNYLKAVKDATTENTNFRWSFGDTVANLGAAKLVFSAKGDAQGVYKYAIRKSVDASYTEETKWSQFTASGEWQVLEFSLGDDVQDYGSMLFLVDTANASLCLDNVRLVDADGEDVLVVQDFNALTAGATATNLKDYNEELGFPEGATATGWTFGGRMTIVACKKAADPIEVVIEGESKGYATLSEALAAATDGAAIKLLADVELGADERNLTIAANDVTFDLDGHKLTFPGPAQEAAVQSAPRLLAAEPDNGAVVTVTGDNVTWCKGEVSGTMRVQFVLASQGKGGFTLKGNTFNLPVYVNGKSASPVVIFENVWPYEGTDVEVVNYSTSKNIYALGLNELEAPVVEVVSNVIENCRVNTSLLTVTGGAANEHVRIIDNVFDGVCAAEGPMTQILAAGEVIVRGNVYRNTHRPEPTYGAATFVPYVWGEGTDDDKKSCKGVIVYEGNQLEETIDYIYGVNSLTYVPYVIVFGENELADSVDQINGANKKKMAEEAPYEAQLPYPYGTVDGVKSSRLPEGLGDYEEWELGKYFVPGEPPAFKTEDELTAGEVFFVKPRDVVPAGAEAATEPSNIMAYVLPQPEAAVYVNGVPYATIELALEAVKYGDTIVLAQNLDSEFNLPAGVTLELGEFTADGVKSPTGNAENDYYTRVDGEGTVTYVLNDNAKPVVTAIVPGEAAAQLTVANVKEGLWYAVKTAEEIDGFDAAVTSAWTQDLVEGGELAGVLPEGKVGFFKVIVSDDPTGKEQDE